MKRKTNAVSCGVHHLAALRRELAEQGLSLRNASGAAQRDMLVRVLQYLGPRGLGTLEAVALGFYRAATRVHELVDAGYVVSSQREAVVGADGLYHAGCARYVLLGRADDKPEPQLVLDLDAA